MLGFMRLPLLLAALCLALVFLTLALGKALPAGGEIAFVSLRTGNYQLFTMDIAHSLLLRLSRSHVNHTDPTWTSDGRQLAFIVSQNGNAGGIYMMNFDGSSLRRISETSSTTGDQSVSWSPDGGKVAFVSWRDGNAEIYAAGIEQDVSARRLTENRVELDLAPSWSPDGQQIAFVSWRDGNSEIYVMDADGGNLRRLTRYPGLDVGPNWSRDGQHIAFVSNRDGNSEIYVMDADGDNVRRLTYNNAADTSPSWSPDSQHIVFVSDRDGNAEIYIMDTDGNNMRRLTYNRAADTSPAWRPD